MSVVFHYFKIVGAKFSLSLSNKDFLKFSDFGILLHKIVTLEKKREFQELDYIKLPSKKRNSQAVCCTLVDNDKLRRVQDKVT